MTCRMLLLLFSLLLCVNTGYTWYLDVAQQAEKSFSRRVWIGLDRGSWSYELNPRLSESSLEHRIEKNGELFLEPTSSCAGYPETTFINAWSLNPSCAGLVYLTYPVQITNSSCPLVNSGRGVNYYGLVCSDDRTNWCQREYKDDLIWPKEIGRTCGIQRTGVDKSRCYSDGKLEVTFNLECELKNGEIVFTELTYHLLQDERKARAHARQRVRRALTLKPPFFKLPLYVVNVKEEGIKNHVVTTIPASSPDNSPIEYSLVSLLDSRSQDMFSIDPSTGQISTNNKLDREFMDVHYLRIVAALVDDTQLSATATLQVNVEDVNDNSPQFEEKVYKSQVKESVAVGSTVTTVRATDTDSGRNSDILYSIQSQSSKPDVFRIDPKSGVISTRLPLDREREGEHTLVVEATDQGPPGERLSSTTNVFITVLDENDNYPQFSQKTYNIEVSEGLDWSTKPIVGQVEAKDADEGLNSVLYYSVIGGNTANQFAVNEDSGEISVVKQLDHETTKNYRLVIRAQDRGSPTRSNTTQVVIKVVDVNDHSPKFYSGYFQEAVPENVPIGYSVVRIQAYDGDEGENSRITYSIVDATDAVPFAIDERTGWLTSTELLDREGQSSYQFGVEASDNGAPRRAEKANIIIQVQDRNDNDPTFQKKIYEAVASETDPPGTSVLSLLALDKDENARVHYEITGGNTRNRFSISTQNAQGVISIAQPLDYQQEKRFLLTVSATDSGGRFDTATVYINISDANTHPPSFENAPYSVSVFEDAPVGTTVLVVLAADKDVGENARITYDISNQESGDFKIDPNSGSIIINRALDREEKEVYVLTVTAHDNGIPKMSDTTDVEIVIVDVNDNKPSFTQPAYHGAVSEDAIPGTSILEILANDRDQNLNGRIMYTFDGGNNGDGAFVVDVYSGIVRTNRPLDRETVPYYELVALAVDRGTPQLSSTVPILVNVLDINDNPPKFEGEQLEYFIKENSPVGSLVAEIEAIDPDEGENAVVTYSIIGGRDAHLFHLDTEVGKPIARLISDTEFDHESDQTEYDLLLRAESPPLRTDIPLLVRVKDENDNSPQLNDFSIVFNNYENNFPTTPIGKIPAFDADALDMLYYNITYGNNANLLILNPNTGEITLSPKLNTNVPIHAKMGVSVFDGKNEVRSVVSLDVLLVTKEMMHHSVTLRLNNMTQDAFLSPLFSFFVDALSAVIPAPQENIHVFSIKSDTEVQGDILNVTFSVGVPGSLEEQYLDPEYIQHKIYLNLETLVRLSTIKILPFDDNICIREPCLNYETCETRLMFGSAKHFIEGESILFRSIHAVKTYSCECPEGFTGEKNHYTCDIEVNMCYSNPCHNSGTCISKEGGYTCSCQENYTGENCEISLLQGGCVPDVCAPPSSCAPLIKGGFICENCTQSPFYNQFCQLEARSFSNGAFLSLPSLKQRFKFNIKLDFATIEHTGLLMYNGRYNGKHDYMSLSVQDEGLVFRFSTGEESSSVSVHPPGGISDGQWHSVEVKYYNRSAILILDDCDWNLALESGLSLGSDWQCANRTVLTDKAECSDFLNSCHTLLDLTGPLQLGSLPVGHQADIPPLDGCIRNLYIDSKFTDLNSYIVNNGTLTGCPERREFCMSHPCQNKGQCREGWGGYVCECTEGWGGKNCGDKLKPAMRFAGNGFAVYSAGLYPIQLPWTNGLSFRTRSESGLLELVQLRTLGWSKLELVNGTLRYTLGDTSLQLITPRLNDGEWHHVSVKWMMGEVWLNLDYGQHELTKPTNIAIQGLTVVKVFVGGSEPNIDGSTSTQPFTGCIQNVRIGDGDGADLSPTQESSVESGCSSPDTCTSDTCPASSQCSLGWDSHQCNCNPGHIGDKCFDVCKLSPCHNNSTCVKNPVDPRGYSCSCGSPLLHGAYCEEKVQQPCPAKWWGYPVCGPCKCDVNNGFNPDCDKKTGECRCKDYHYQPKNTDKCLPCKCFPLGSTGQLCDPISGQCQCKPGVIGQLCDSCAHKYAEVTEHGCQVVYESCPKAYESEVWWPRTRFGEEVKVECPVGAEGFATRRCSSEHGWDEPDLFNCTHKQILPLFKDLAQLETGEIQINSYLALKTVKNLYDLTNSIDELYGADVLLFSRLLVEILEFENKQSGFNLSHKQERDFIKQIVSIASRILKDENEVSLNKGNTLDRNLFSRILNLFKKYGQTLTENLSDTYTNPFEIITDNVMFGLDIIDNPREGNPQSRILPELPRSSSLISQEPRLSSDYISIPKYNHYMRDPRVWDNTKIYIPRSLLFVDGEDSPDTKPTVSYAIYRTLSNFLPDQYLPDLVARWGSIFKPLSSVVALTLQTDTELTESVELTMPISLIFSVKLSQEFTRSTPFCARWDVSIKESQGWTKDACETDLPDLWQFNKASEITVNCTCYKISSYVVLSESAAEGLVVANPLPSENIVLYATIASLIILLICGVCFSSLYGLPTNSNSIHRFIVLSLFLAQILFIIEAKFHHIIVKVDVGCKIMAILLHYFWLSVFSWLLVDALHLQRMLTEMRDINHGNMKFYISMGFGIPAIIVGLSVGVRSHQYGNLHFCWLSLYDISVWSMVGPLCISLFVQICILFLAIRAAFTLKSQIEDFGNLRGLLLLNIGLLPLATGTWTSAFFLVNEDWPELSIANSVATLLTSAYIFLGYIVFNSRVRTGIKNRYLVCLGRKLPYGESLNASHGTISRSALAYRNSVKSSNRNIGISTASTTSRSTSKTNSTPYRSDYYSSSDVSKIYGSHKSGEKLENKYRKESDSESDADQRSLDLASSHSSDEDDPLEPVTSSDNTRGTIYSTDTNRGNLYSTDTTRGNVYSTDYNMSVPPLHINTSSGSAGLQVNDQPISAQNTLQRQHLSRDLRLPNRWSERLSAVTTSDNDNTTDTINLGYNYNYGYPQPQSPDSELSSEDKYVAMSPPHLMQYQAYSTSTTSQNYSTSDPSSSMQPSDISPESQNLSSYQS